MRSIQTVSQVQIAGCLAHCAHTRQSQFARQRDIVVRRAAGPTRSISTRGDGGFVIQIRLGCVSHCFSRTKPASRIGGRRRRLTARLLRALADRGLRAVTALSRVQANVASQSSFQLQQGTTSTVAQTQSAVQALLLIATPAMRRQAAAGTRQAIFQLQIGCVAFCVHTRQYQHADQSVTTIYAGPALQAFLRPAMRTHQEIWQLQIGCLFWCYDVVQRQSAAHTAIAILLRQPATARPKRYAAPDGSEEPSLSPPPTESTRSPAGSEVDSDAHGSRHPRGRTPTHAFPSVRPGPPAVSGPRLRPPALATPGRSAGAGHANRRALRWSRRSTRLEPRVAHDALSGADQEKGSTAWMLAFVVLLVVSSMPVRLRPLIATQRHERAGIRSSGRGSQRGERK